ncbi:tRNA pseudouridine(38-40) synthase TruA [Bhargavaea beijingensis]|uniref:tRNA pseudouridine synthase A n=1 Tax=Bhargavaea beijingensis TaxID=426756 RepID=A0A1G6XVL9_9BACL|nr:tRNA pseudouridine(38-40) synthase TruA [Bhargavaea beijingensis]MCW1927943.1 tRNA pseudouridine(38-40) synthase TruA [Bhargavaea beijingensis]RSK25131.1 tRNA pseudouridine(38-40) synthase TruA [Bhargavaea beijingensis]SDD82274.1 tRNA pseudouridine38-40 synthase [Bhargavaea beijingensis]
MPRIKLIIAYDGSGFEGYQIQPKGRTVQGELEQALSVIHKGEAVRVHASGRTDAGVHASGQVVHFDTPLGIPDGRWAMALNTRLPGAIRVLSAETVPDRFHARFSATGKTYRYIWHLSEVISPFRRYFTTPSLGVTPDVAKMEEGARHLIGTHDFTSFCSAKTDVEDKVRTVESIRFERHGEELHMVITGSGFLYNMVRIIAGTLWMCGKGELDPAGIPGILAAKDRSKAGKTAQAQGLYLEKVRYGE